MSSLTSINYSGSMPSLVIPAVFLLVIFIGITTNEIEKINSRDTGYATEAQKILSLINNITSRLNTFEEACHNNFGRILSDFDSINASIEALQNEMIRHYTLAVARRIQPIETDQLSVASQSETSSQSHANSSSRSPYMYP
jgi:hypothetical protein